jgi:hypothetical protein|tara:strand:- start:201 stop:353 length:153 start_codon:yes stop_codon:yes gene_type:complete
MLGINGKTKEIMITPCCGATTLDMNERMTMNERQLKKKGRTNNFSDNCPL